MENFNFVVMNPNVDKTIVSTDLLNIFSKAFRDSDFYKKYVSQDGFELSIADFKWEWIINFNNKSGFMVMRELGYDLKLYVYEHCDDLYPTEVLIKDFKNEVSQIRLLNNLIKDYYRNNIQ